MTRIPDLLEMKTSDRILLSPCHNSRWCSNSRLSDLVQLRCCDWSNDWECGFGLCDNWVYVRTRRGRVGLRKEQGDGKNVDALKDKGINFFFFFLGRVVVATKK